MKRLISLVLLASCCSLLNAGCGCGRPPRPQPKTQKPVPSKVQESKEVQENVVVSAAKGCGCGKPKPPRK